MNKTKTESTERKNYDDSHEGNITTKCVQQNTHSVGVLM